MRRPKKHATEVASESLFSTAAWQPSGSKLKALSPTSWSTSALMTRLQFWLGPTLSRNWLSVK